MGSDMGYHLTDFTTVTTLKQAVESCANMGASLPILKNNNLMSETLDYLKRQGGIPTSKKENLLKLRLAINFLKNTSA